MIVLRLNRLVRVVVCGCLLLLGLGCVVLSLGVHLLNNLLHELAGLAQLLELLLEFEVEAAEGDYLVGGTHELDAGEQVMRHVV